MELAYLYFQIPLMILVIAPAIDGLRRSGARRRRTSARAGSSTGATWAARALALDARRRDPALRNSFAAYATAYSLTSGTGLPLVPILIGTDLSGNVLSNPHEGQALAFGMFVVLAAMMLFYIPLQRRASRWAR